MLELIICEIKSIANQYFVFLIIAVGLFSYFVDASFLGNKKLLKEEKVAKGIGITYMSIGILIFIVFIIILK